MDTDIDEIHVFVHYKADVTKTATNTDIFLKLFGEFDMHEFCKCCFCPFLLVLYFSSSQTC